MSCTDLSDPCPRCGSSCVYDISDDTYTPTAPSMFAQKAKDMDKMRTKIRETMAERDAANRLLRDVLHGFRQYDMNPHDQLARNQMRERVAAAEKHLEELT